MLLVAAVVVLAALVSGYRLVAAARGDLAKAIVDRSARHLAVTRPDWSRAMGAELEYIEGRPSRLRFALGCARAALVAPIVQARRAVGTRVTVAVAATALVAVFLLAERRLERAPATGRYGTGVELAVGLVALAAIAAHCWLASRRLGDSSVQAAVARRAGMLAGAVLGTLSFAGSVPFPGTAGLVGPEHEFAMGAIPLVACGALVSGLAAARVSGDRRAGFEAGVWAGRVGGGVMAIGLLAVTLWALGWYLHDPATIAAYRDSLAGEHFASYHTHYRSLAGFVLSENVDTAMIGALVVFPCLGLAFGYLGGLLGAAHRGSARPTPGEALQETHGPTPC